MHTSGGVLAAGAGRKKRQMVPAGARIAVTAGRLTVPLDGASSRVTSRYPGSSCNALTDRWRCSSIFRHPQQRPSYQFVKYTVSCHVNNNPVVTGLKKDSRPSPLRSVGRVFICLTTPVNP